MSPIYNPSKSAPSINTIGMLNPSISSGTIDTSTPLQQSFNLTGLVTGLIYMLNVQCVVPTIGSFTDGDYAAATISFDIGSRGLGMPGYVYEADGNPYCTAPGGSPQYSGANLLDSTDNNESIFIAVVATQSTGIIYALCQNTGGFVFSPPTLTYYVYQAISS